MTGHDTGHDRPRSVMTGHGGNHDRVRGRPSIMQLLSLKDAIMTGHNRPRTRP